MSFGNKKFFGAQHVDLRSQLQSVFLKIAHNKVFNHSKCMLTYIVYRFSGFIAVFYFIVVDTTLGNKYL